MYKPIENINKAICEYFKVKIDYPFTDNRKRNQAHIRYIFFYLCDKHLSRTLTQQDYIDYVIDNFTVRYARTNVCHAKKKIQGYLDVDKMIINDVNQIELKLI